MRRGEAYPSHSANGNPVPEPLLFGSWMPALLPSEPEGQLGGSNTLRGHVHCRGLTRPLEGSRLILPVASMGALVMESPLTICRPTGKGLTWSLVGSKLREPSQLC